MNTLGISILLVFGGVCTMLAAEADTEPTTLERARELGRMKSRLLNETNRDTKANHNIPAADLSRFEESIEPILNKRLGVETESFGGSTGTLSRV